MLTIGKNEIFAAAGAALFSDTALIVLVPGESYEFGDQPRVARGK